MRGFGEAVIILSRVKIIFFGLGSIGQRHANILLKNYNHTLYAFRSGTTDLPNSLGIKELYSFGEIEKLKPDIAFITNPTNLHIETAIKCAKLGCKLFIEKPIGKDLEGLDKLLQIVKEKNLTTYVAYNLRFNPVIIKLKKYIDKHKILHARVVCTSFLPNWHPNANHLESYSANAGMGGGVILDLSHEIDYISYLLGEVKNIQGNYSKRSNVTIDAEDYADILIDTNSCPVNIHINFLSQIRQRYIQLDFEGLSITADLINIEIKEYAKEKLNNSFKLDYEKGQEYVEQLKYFFDNIENPNMMNNITWASNLYKKIINFKSGNYE